MAQEPFNPLDKLRLAESISQALLQRALIPLPGPGSRMNPDFLGAGVYAIYYLGDFEPYRSILAAGAQGGEPPPIYVGKATPPGGRIGGMGTGPVSASLRQRLRNHAQSINEVDNLNLDDFRCRHLVVDDIFIPLGENRLIDLFQPLWNVKLGGFGNNPTGRRREAQQRSAWDTVHPGRRRAAALAPNPRTVDEILAMLRTGLVVEREEEPLPSDADET